MEELYEMVKRFVEIDENDVWDMGEMMDRMSDDDLLATVRSRHVQSPSEIIAWSKELAAHAEVLEREAQSLIEAENSKQEAEEAAAAAGSSAASE